MSIHAIDKISQFYLAEANRCAEKQLYFASCILNGAALEALLLETCYVYPAQVIETKSAKKRKVKTEAGFMNLDLKALIDISLELGWFDTITLENGREMSAQKVMKSVKEIRNLIHPGKWGRDHKDVIISEDHYKNVSAIMFAIIKQLISLPFSEKMKDRLPEAMKKIFSK